MLGLALILQLPMPSRTHCPSGGSRVLPMLDRPFLPAVWTYGRMEEAEGLAWSSRRPGDGPGPTQEAILLPCALGGDARATAWSAGLPLDPTAPAEPVRARALDAPVLPGDLVRPLGPSS